MQEFALFNVFTDINFKGINISFEIKKINGDYVKSQNHVFRKLSWA